MNSKKFPVIHLNHLGINNVHALFHETYEIAEPVKGFVGEPANILLKNLIADTDTLGAQLKLVQKSDFTQQIKLSDKQRNSDFAEIKRDITYYAKGSDASKQPAATRLKSAFAPYWNMTIEPLVTETKSFDSFFKVYKTNASLQADAALIGIDVKIDALEVANKNLNALYKIRNTEQGARDALASASRLRPIATDAYNEFCAAIEQATAYVPNETLTTLFNDMKELRKKYHALIKTHKTDDTKTQDTTT
jgi:hypothetical protein